MSQEIPSSYMLSERGVRTAGYTDFLHKKTGEVLSNSYHAEKNPKGIVDLGTATNSLMDEEVCRRLNKGDALHMKPHHLHYSNFSGTKDLREAVANFLNRHFKPLKPITQDKENIECLPCMYLIPRAVQNNSNVILCSAESEMSAMCGATACLDGLAHVLCDRGDVAITPIPVYSSIQRHFVVAANVKVEPLDLLDEVHRFVVEMKVIMDLYTYKRVRKGGLQGETFRLQPEALERRITELRAEGRRVRAFILINPQNPLGDVYNPALLTKLLDVCARNEVHFIADEVYAHSVHDEITEFRSVLTLDLPDPMRTHVVWSMSKVFGLAGFRVGVVLSQCANVHEYFHNICYYRVIPWIIQHAAAMLLKDTVWCDEVYLPTYRKRLAHNYRLTCERLDGMGLRVRRASAGLFVWFSVKSFLQQLTMEEESALLQEILDGGLYILMGNTLHCTSPGWMRLVFSVTEAELNEGLNRLEAVLMARKKLSMEEPYQLIRF